MHIVTQENAGHVMKHLIKLLVGRKGGCCYPSRPILEARSPSGPSLNSMLTGDQTILSLILFGVPYSYTLLRFTFSSALLMALLAWSRSSECVEILHLNRWAELPAPRIHVWRRCPLLSGRIDHCFLNTFVCATLGDGCPPLLRIQRPWPFSSASDCRVSMWPFVHHMTSIICLQSLHRPAKVGASILVHLLRAILAQRHWGLLWPHMRCVIVWVNDGLVDIMSWLLDYMTLSFLEINGLILLGLNILRIPIILFGLWSCILIELLDLCAWFLLIILAFISGWLWPGFRAEPGWCTCVNNSLWKSIQVGCWPLMIFFCLSWVRCAFDHLSGTVGLVLLE